MDFQIPDWWTSVLPRRSPYYPQIGDEVIYFVQGHQKYVEAVKAADVYRTQPWTTQPWHKHSQQIMKVVNVWYEVEPPRLVCYDLAFVNKDSHELTGGSFTVK